MENEPIQASDITEAVLRATQKGLHSEEGEFMKMAYKLATNQPLGPNERELMLTGIVQAPDYLKTLHDTVRYQIEKNLEHKKADIPAALKRFEAIVQAPPQAQTPPHARDTTEQALSQARVGEGDLKTAFVDIANRHITNGEIGPNDKALLKLAFEEKLPDSRGLEMHFRTTVDDQMADGMIRQKLTMQEVNTIAGDVMLERMDTLRKIGAELTPAAGAATKMNDAVKAEKDTRTVVVETTANDQPFGFTVGYREKPGDLTDADTRSQTTEFRFDSVRHETPLNMAGGSDVEALKIGEHNQAREYFILLPANKEGIRQYLQNDGYLSNEELSRTLSDASLTKDELAHKVDLIADKGSVKADPAARREITDYLWDVHKTVMDSPLLLSLDPMAKYTLSAISQPPVLDTAATDTAYKKAVDDGDPKAKKKASLLSETLGLKLLEGSMAANFVHNAKTTERILDRLGELFKPPEHRQKMETPTAIATRWDYKDVAKQLEKNGVTEEMFKKSGNLDDFLNGRKTGLMQLNKNDGEGTITPIKGVLYITDVPGQGPVVFLTPERQDLRMPKTFLGHELTEADKSNLLKTGTMGRVVELKDKVDGEKFNAYVGVDPNTKSLTVARVDRIHMPSTLKGVELNPKQLETLKDGGAAQVNGLMGLDGKPYSAIVQIAPYKRSFSFQRLPEQAIKEKATVSQKVKTPKIEVKEQMKGETKTVVKQEVAAVKQEQKKADEKKVAPEGGTKKNDEVKKVSVQAKNGQTRTSEDTTTGATQVVQKADTKQGLKKVEANVNGKAQTPKEAPKPGTRQKL